MLMLRSFAACLSGGSFLLLCLWLPEAAAGNTVTKRLLTPADVLGEVVIGDPRTMDWNENVTSPVELSPDGAKDTVITRRGELARNNSAGEVALDGIADVVAGQRARGP